MATPQLKAFLKQKQAEATPPPMDWFARRDDYIQAVVQLYDTIANNYLGGEDTEGLVSLDRSQTRPIKEEHIGDYRAPQMLLDISDQRVHFWPKGTNLVGATGRVDVRGEGGEVMLVRQSDGNWSVVLARTPKLLLIPLDEESFLSVLERVMR